MPPTLSKHMNGALFDRLHIISDTCALKKKTYTALGELADSHEIMFKVKKEGNWDSIPIQHKYRVVRGLKQQFGLIKGCKERVYVFLALKTNVEMSTEGLDKEVVHNEALTKSKLVNMCEDMIRQVLFYSIHGKIYAY